MAQIAQHVKISSSNEENQFPSQVVVKLKENAKVVTLRSEKAYEGPELIEDNSQKEDEGVPKSVECEIENELRESEPHHSEQSVHREKEKE